MRLGLVGDVHAEDERLGATLLALRQAKVDLVLCTGDVVDGPGDVDRACALLVEQRVLTVRGNHDRWIREDERRDVAHAHRMTMLAPESIGFLKELPLTRAIDIPGGVLHLCHGVGTDDMAELLPTDHGYALAKNPELLKLLFDPKVRFMVGGHTHVPMVREMKRGEGLPSLVVVNPGTLFREDEPGYFVVDTDERRVETYRLGERLTVVPVSRAVL
jgi:predicted phosphodiesterase